MKRSLLTIAAMLALGFSTRYAGLDATTGLAFASTGVLFPFFSPLLAGSGWRSPGATPRRTSSSGGSSGSVPSGWGWVPRGVAYHHPMGNDLMRPLLSRSAAVLLATVILVPARWAAAAPAAQRDAAERIAEILEAQRGEQHIPGFAFALVRQDRLELVIVRGVRDVEHALPVTPDTVFPIGSCTKAFTSMALGIAQDQHLLSLDDHPRRFLPWFHMADPRADAEVTLRDMLSHRTGLKAKADLAATPGVLNREEYVRATTAARSAAPFRTTFQYSNAMYSAAGEVLGSAYHSSWENVIQNRSLRRSG